MDLSKLVLLTAYRAHLVKRNGCYLHNHLHSHIFPMEYLKIMIEANPKLKENSVSVWVMYVNDGLFGGTYEAK